MGWPFPASSALLNRSRKWMLDRNFDRIQPDAFSFGNDMSTAVSRVDYTPAHFAYSSSVVTCFAADRRADII